MIDTIDYIELYVGEKKAIQYQMYLDNAIFVPDSASIEIFNGDNTLNMSSDCNITSNNMHFIIPLTLTTATGKYRGVYTIIKGEQIYKKVISIDIKSVL